MKSVYIRVKEFEFINILTFEELKRVNEHGIAKVSGYIPIDLEETYLEMVSKEHTFVNIEILDEQKEDIKTIFSGVITSFNIISKNKIKILELEIKTLTQLMDTKEHIRTFQKSSIKYKDILKIILDNYPNGNYISTLEHNKNIENLILQYKETDWEFLKRIASHFNSVLIPDTETFGTKFYFGVPNFSSNIVINTNEYKMCKYNVMYDYKKGFGLNIRQYDEIEYIFEDRNVYRIGDRISFNNKNLCVYKIETRFNKDELVHTYYLRTENGFKIPKYYNELINGLSLMGNVKQVDKTYVKVGLDLDENKDKTGDRWFLYSTVYSSADGTGWYCMPEINDKIRLHFPDRDEANAYVISSYHLESEDKNERKNPDFKSIMNKYKKEILLTPNSLVLTNNNGMSIEIKDGQGINITSNKNIYMKANNNINIRSNLSNIKMVSTKNVILQQNKNKLHLKEDITVKGEQTKIE